MAVAFAEDSVGLVTPQTAHFDEPLLLACGRSLAPWQLVFETYGTLNEKRSNAVLICHALSGHHHAAGFHREDERKPGWWDTAAMALLAQPVLTPPAAKPMARIFRL